MVTDWVGMCLADFLNFPGHPGDKERLGLLQHATNSRIQPNSLILIIQESQVLLVQIFHVSALDNVWGAKDAANSTKPPWWVWPAARDPSGHPEPVPRLWGASHSPILQPALHTVPTVWAALVRVQTWAFTGLDFISCLRGKELVCLFFCLFTVLLPNKLIRKQAS